MWLSDNYKDIKLIRATSIHNSHILFNEGKADVLAGLKPKLIEELSTNNQLKIIEDPFTSIKQSVGIKKGSPQVIKFLNDLILKLINDGFIEQLLKKYKVENKLSIPKLSFFYTSPRLRLGRNSLIYTSNNFSFRIIHW